ncbi:NRDE family protein [Castellaniella sp. GW247-6E4]|uniref:NRDE family protein n=1 Tax=Castellaniella sp. GW247-6E4 TaxID=3140380 RepID=UPI0033152AC5
MCIAYLAIGDPRWPLFIAANRDEYHARPTAAAAPWADRPDIIGGLDLLAGGTWLGWARAGRFALLTNYREPGNRRSGTPSRGVLVRDFLRGDAPAAVYAADIQSRGEDYKGFNLIVGDTAGVHYASNRDPLARARPLASGRYVLSNHLLDTPWPKAGRLRAALDARPPEVLADDPDGVFAVLRDAEPADDAILPATGVSIELERLLSSPFIVSPDYGTRCTTVIAVAADGHALFSEQSYDPAGRASERHDWRLPPTPPRA